MNPTAATLLDHGKRSVLGLLLAAGLAGCGTLQTAVSDEARYGKLNAMRDALDAAATRCNDATLARANYWLNLGASDLKEQLRFLPPASAEFQEAKGLLAALHDVRYAKTPRQTCERVRTAAKSTGTFIAFRQNGAVRVARN